MIDWSRSMQHSFEYYEVDPYTWHDIAKIDSIYEGTIVRDRGSETLGNASFKGTKLLDECYVRTYLVVTQGMYTEKVCLGTHLIQTPSHTFDGKIKIVNFDAYTPLLELKEKPPPIGYTLFKNTNVLDSAYKLTRESTRTPVVKNTHAKNLERDFVSSLDDTYASFNIDLLKSIDYQYELDDYCRIMFGPIIPVERMQPKYIFNDDNSSIMYEDISVDQDIYGIPNVVEVVHSQGSSCYTCTVKNEELSSPVSTVRRGREIIYRETNCNFAGLVNEGEIEIYAKNLLESLSTIQFTITVKHGYVPITIDDCVMINYTKAGITNLKGKIINQSISCVPGCPVTSKIQFNATLWEV